MTTLAQVVNETDDYRVLNPIVCKDGFKISVQASNGHHCHDSSGTADHYWRNASPVLPWVAVECGYPSERPEPWHCTKWEQGFDRHEDHGVCDGWQAYAEEPDSEDGGSVYSYVPVSVVRALIESHGGEA